MIELDRANNSVLPKKLEERVSDAGPMCLVNSASGPPHPAYHNLTFEVSEFSKYLNIPFETGFQYEWTTRMERSRQGDPASFSYQSLRYDPSSYPCRTSSNINALGGICEPKQRPTG